MATDQETLSQAFAAFSKFGNTKSDRKTITLSQIDKWLKQADLFDKKLTTTDTAINFKKFKTKTMDMDTFQKFIETICKEKKLKVDDVMKKLARNALPGTTNTTATDAAGVVDRLTDTSQYTGSHKERFDESGKGKGIEGRADIKNDSGYVSGYKHKDTYDEKKMT